MRFHKTGSVGLVLHQDGTEHGIAIGKRTLDRIRAGESMTIKGAGLLVEGGVVQDVWGFNTIERGSIVVNTLAGDPLAASTLGKITIIES